MIKARATTEKGDPIYVFGLSSGNLNRLRMGKPMWIELKELGGVGHVLIAGGETEQSIYQDMVRAGIKFGKEKWEPGMRKPNVKDIPPEGI